MSQIEKKIQQEVKESIRNQKQDKINFKVVKNEIFQVNPSLKNKMNHSILFACIGESMGFISYFYAAYVGNSLLMNQLDYQQLFWYGLLTILAIALQKILTGMSTIRSHEISFTILRDIRIKLSEKIQKIPLGLISITPIGTFKNTILDRVGSLEDWIAHVMPELPSRLMHPLLATIILFFVDYRLGLACFASLPFIILGFMLMMRNREERMYTWMNANQDLNARIVEYVNGIEVIKVFGQTKRSYHKFSESANYYYESTMGWWRQSWLSMAILYAFINSPIIGTLPVGFYLFSQGEISAWALMMGLILPLSIIPNGFEILSSFEITSMVESNWRIIRNMLNWAEIERPSEPVQLDDQRNFEFKNVSFEYESDIEVLKDVSFTVKPNQVFAIVGESGSGKSTIAKLMAGFFDATKGEITFGGINVKNISHNQLMSQIAYVSQDNFLFDISIKENLLISNPMATDQQIMTAIRTASCEELIQKLPGGINSLVGECGGLLSGGERQRLTLARALLSNAQCILLDEATAYTDPDNETEIQSAITQLAQNKTLIVIAHRLHTIVEADQIMVINKGQVESIGTHNQLLENSSTYLSLWNKYMMMEEGR